LPVELDRSRPIYCDDCIAIVRDERKGKSGLKAGSGSAGKGKPAFQVERPPKPTEGEVIEKFPDEPSISLGALAKPEKVPPKATEPEKILRVDTALDGPSLDLGALIQAQPKPRMEERKPRPEVRKSTPRSESYAYTCSDCGSSFTAGVKLDPSRPLYCENCLTKIRERRKADTASKPPSTVTNVGGEAPLEKRKRKRKKKPAQTIMSDRTQSFAAPVSVPYPSPVPQPEPKDQTGTLHTGQTIRFD